MMLEETAESRLQFGVRPGGGNAPVESQCGTFVNSPFDVGVSRIDDQKRIHGTTPRIPGTRLSRLLSSPASPNPAVPYIGILRRDKIFPTNIGRWNHEPRALRSLSPHGELAAGGGAVAERTTLHGRVSRPAHAPDGCV